jgi:uncharacterized protein involved in exopolysaccharide biosynthesis
MKPLSVNRSWLPGRTPWGRALKVGVAGAAAALVLGLFAPNQYTSVARILPMAKPGQGNLGAMAAPQAMSGFNLGNNASPFEQALPEILRSRTVLDRVLAKEYDYHQRSWRFGADTANHRTLQEVLGAPDRDVAVQRLSSLLDVQKDLKSGVLTVKVTLPSADLAQEVNQALMTELEGFLVQLRNERGRSTAEFMAERVRATRAELEDALTRYLGFASRERGYAFSSDPLVKVEGQKLEFEVEYRKQVLLRLQQQVDAAIIEEKDATPVMSMLDRPTLPIQKTGPSRVMWALGAFLLATVATLVWERRAQLFEAEPGESA